jgi:hypothetical protein
LVRTKEQNTDRQHEALKEYATSNKLITKSYLRIDQVVKISKDRSKAIKDFKTVKTINSI